MPVERARRAEVDIFDTGGVAQPGGSGTGLEALLLPQRHLMIQDQAELFSMVRCRCLRVVAERLEAFVHAMQAGLVQQLGSGMGQHACRPLRWKQPGPRILRWVTAGRSGEAGSGLARALSSRMMPL